MTLYGMFTFCAVYALAVATPEKRYQLERLGYFTLDPDSTVIKQVWNRTVTLKDTWAKLEGRAPSRPK